MQSRTTPSEVQAVNDTEEEGWPCAACGRPVDPTVSLWIKFKARPGERIKVWHPTCPPANDVDRPQ